MQPCCSRCADSNGVRNVHRRWNEQQICHMPLGETIRRLGLWSGLEWEEDARTRPHAAPLALLRLRHSSDVLSTCAPRSSCDLHPLTVGEQLEGTAAAPAAQTAHAAANASAQAFSQLTSRPVDTPVARLTDVCSSARQNCAPHVWIRFEWCPIGVLGK